MVAQGDQRWTCSKQATRRRFQLAASESTQRLRTLIFQQHYTHGHHAAALNLPLGLQQAGHAKANSTRRKRGSKAADIDISTTLHARKPRKSTRRLSLPLRINRRWGWAGFRSDVLGSNRHVLCGVSVNVDLPFHLHLLS
jgi:hypothetical protein